MTTAKQPNNLASIQSPLLTGDEIRVVLLLAREN